MKFRRDTVEANAPPKTEHTNTLRAETMAEFKLDFSTEAQRFFFHKAKLYKEMVRNLNAQK